MIRPDETLYWDDSLSDHGKDGSDITGSMLVASGNGSSRWVLDVEFAPDVDVEKAKDLILTAFSS